MLEFIKSTGVFIYPLAVCSLVGAFIIFERLYALRRSAVLPSDLVEAIVSGRPASGGMSSVLGRILTFDEQHQHDEEAVRSFSRLEVNRMERGLVFLEVIIGAAPLIGLLGTVVGLVQVFDKISIEAGSANQAAFSQGIALALSTTVIGLIIASPCLVGNGYLQRSVETYAVQIESLLERINAGSKHSKNLAAAASASAK
jgi:biopolymer transport protein ExbB